jgi:hypothetical protein
VGEWRGYALDRHYLWVEQQGCHDLSDALVCLVDGGEIDEYEEGGRIYRTKAVEASQFPEGLRSRA